MPSDRLLVYQIPVCPYCQRLQILLALKGRVDDVEFRVIDITVPRPEWLLAKTRGSTALPVLELPDGRIRKDSLVLMRYLDEAMPESPIAQRDPSRRAIEGMLERLEDPFAVAGSTWMLNQDPARRDALREALLAQYARIDAFLTEHSPDGLFLFDEFGWAEAVFTPLLIRFWFLEYYEGFTLPDEPRFARVRRWLDACLAHPAAQQISKEEIVKVYYDFAKGAGNGRTLPGRAVSSFALSPDWRARPWPPADKYGTADLGLTP